MVFDFLCQQKYFLEHNFLMNYYFMKGFQSVIILFLLVAFSAVASAQNLRENERVVIGGEKYVLHQVRTGETIYSISDQFNVDRETLLEHNPKMADGLKIGMVLKIPFRAGADLSDQPVYKKGDPSRFIFHTIDSRKETPYFIAKEYGITVEELYAYNPEVKRFRKGKKLRIPRWDAPGEEATTEKMAREKPSAEKEKEALIKHQVVSGETLYSIAKRYRISESEILFYNPGAKDLKAGSIIYLPRTKETARMEEALAEEEKTEEQSALRELEERDKPGKEEAQGNRPVVSGPEASPGATANYFEHTIVSGETLWSITRKYDVPEDELKRLNPVLESGFPAGVTLKIPVKEDSFSKAEPVNEDAFMKHHVQKGETLYGLADQYDMTIPEIRKFNPVLENRNLVSGEVLLIPRRPDEEIVRFMEEKAKDSVAVEMPGFESDYYDIEVIESIPEACQRPDKRFSSGKRYDVALFLPLFVRANDTLNREEVNPDSLLAAEGSSGLLDQSLVAVKDTAVEQEANEALFHRFYKESEHYLQFYEGVLLAVDSLQRAGMNIRIKVCDTQQNPDSVRSFLFSGNFLETDLIIGPVFPDVQKEVAAIAAKNRIPMVSPLAPRSAGLNSNPYLYQINPSREYLAVKTAEMVAEEYFNSNFIVFKTENDNALGEKVVEMAREKMFQSGYWGNEYGVRFSVYDFAREGPFGFGRILSPNKENVVFIPSLNEGELSVALSNINNLSEDYSITLVGFNRYTSFSSIDKDYFHNLKFHYIDPYWVDYDDPSTIRYIRKFRENFFTEPDNFGFQGYDVAFYFLSALKKFGKNFEECLPYMETQLLQGNYHFEKVSPFGGYMNQGVNVISYQRDYDVVRKRVIGQYRFAQK